MTDPGNGRVQMLVDGISRIDTKVSDLQREHSEYQAAAAVRDAHLQQLTEAMDALRAAVDALAKRMAGVEGKTGWLPTTDRAFGYVGAALVGGVVGGLF